MFGELEFPMYQNLKQRINEKYKICSWGNTNVCGEINSFLSGDDEKLWTEESKRQDDHPLNAHASKIAALLILISFNN